MPVLVDTTSQATGGSGRTDHSGRWVTAAMEANHDAMLSSSLSLEKVTWYADRRRRQAAASNDLAPRITTETALPPNTMSHAIITLTPVVLRHPRYRSCQRRTDYRAARR